MLFTLEEVNYIDLAIQRAKRVPKPTGTREKYDPIEYASHDALLVVADMIQQWYDKTLQRERLTPTGDYLDLDIRKIEHLVPCLEQLLIALSKYSGKNFCGYMTVTISNAITGRAELT